MTTVIGAVSSPRRNFTKVDNRIIDDTSLPGPARWVFTILSRLAPGHRFDESWLMRTADLAKNKLREALKVLEDRGVITRRQDNRRSRFGDVYLYIGDQPLPMENMPRVARKSGNGPDQARSGVSAGHTVARQSGDATTYLQDDVPQEQGGPVRNAHAREPEPPTPEPEGQTSMPAYRQTRLPIIGPRKATPQPNPNASPGELVHITPEIRSLNAIQHVTSTICDEWLQRCYRRPPTSFIRQVEVEVYALVVDAIPDDDIRRGMALWMTKGYAPSTIPGFVHQAMNRRALDAHMQQPNRRDLRVAEALAIGERLQAAADARAAG